MDGARGGGGCHLRIGQTDYAPDRLDPDAVITGLESSRSTRYNRIFVPPVRIITQ